MSAQRVAIGDPEPWAVALFAIGMYNLLFGVWVIFKADDLFDFGVFYTSACAWWHGGSPYNLPNLNPPHFSVLLAPLCALAPYPAWIAWQSVNLMAWVVSLGIAWRTRPAPVTFAVVAVLVAHGSTSAQIHMGQVAWVLALPVTLSWLAFRAGASVRAGLWLGAALAVKPFLVLGAAPALLDRRWRVTWVTAAATACGISALGYALLGSQAYTGWAAWFGSAVTFGVAPLNAGLTSFAWFLGISPWVCVAVGVGGALAVLPYWLSTTTDRQWFVMLTVVVLTVPLGWMHYTAWSLPVLWSIWPTLTPRARWALGLLCMPTFALVLGLVPLRLVYPTGLLLLVWAALDREDATSDRPSSTSSSPIINS